MLAGGVAGPAVLCLALPALAQSATTYDRVDEVMDWGAVTTKLILDLGAEVQSGSVNPESFTVTVRRSDPRMDEPVLEEGEVELENAYVSDADGNEADSGRHVTLVPEIGPHLTLNNALNYGADPVVGSNLNAWTENEYTITQQAPIGEVEGIVASELGRQIRPEIDRFQFDSAGFSDEEFGEIELNYAYFAPPEDEGTNPLIVWFHGGGEGGTDHSIPLAANRATAFASDEIQQYFEGAYVLVPQAPTRWMFGPEDERGMDDKNDDAESIYAGAAQALVQSFVDERRDIDIDRVYIGGLSNGGYMTLRLILDNPEYYAAALMVAEPMDLDYVSDEELSAILDIPMWIVTAATDDTVPSQYFSARLYDKLLQLGAEDVQFSYLPRVSDMSDAYVSEDETPYEYPGHFSWIPTYNNHLAYIEGAGGQLYGPAAQEADTVAGREVVTVMEWLAAQSR